MVFERRFRSLLLLFVVCFVLYFICSFNCILLRLSVDVFYYLRKLTSLHTVGYSHFVCVFVLLSAVCEFCLFSFWLLFAVWLLCVKGTEFVKNVHCFLTRKGEHSELKKFANCFFLFLIQRRNKVQLYREVPGGVAHCWRDDNDLG